VSKVGPELGTGSFATVYLMKDLSIDRLVAVKTIRCPTFRAANNALEEVSPLHLLLNLFFSSPPDILSSSLPI